MSSGILHITDSRTGVQYDVPVRRNAVSALDIKKIKAPGDGTDRADQVASGLRVHDPGLQNTTVVETAISFSDHERGLLLFRGHSLEQLWDSDFEDMLHLLVWASYPTGLQRDVLRRSLTEAMLAVPDTVKRTIQSLPGTSSPLSLIVAGLSAYLASNSDLIPASTDANLYRDSTENSDRAIVQTVAAYAVVFGLVSCHRKGVQFTPPAEGRTYLENLFMMAGMADPKTGRPDPVQLSCFRRFAMLNADHGMALAVFSALTTASSLTDPISCLIAAVTAAWGPLHFGATESAQRVLRQIGHPAKVPEYIARVKQGREKLFGYGHRSYKGIDPRVRPIQAILTDLDLTSNRLLKVAEHIETVASTDDFFRRRGLHPNADFYGNFVFTGLGFEPEMIPAAMLAQRIMGIMAHWREYMAPSYNPTIISIISSIIISIMANPSSQSPTEATALLPSQPYSVFTTNQKRLIILTAALASSFSPLSANIYYPALNSLAADLHVSNSQINLTITTYMLCQGLAPAFMGTFADQAGRRPAYIVCFAIYLVGNVALALQHSYAALLVLRAIQSCGSSGTVALASAVAADVITSAERGSYMAITSLGIILAPSLGPLLGGLLSQDTTKLTLPNPLSTLRLLFHRPTGLLLLANGIIFASYYAVTAGIPSQFQQIYHLNDLAIGLVFIPAGIGSLLSTTFNGLVVDWNYRRLKRHAGIPVERTRKQAPDHDHGTFPIERARLQVGGPMTILASLTILLYGPIIDAHPPLPLALALIFTICFAITAAYNILNVLIVDLHYSTPATAMAANNLVRCFLGAAATGAVHPMILAWGNGATYVMFYPLLLLLVVFPLLVPAQIDLPTFDQTLYLKYPNTPWVNPGDDLLMSETHPLPYLSTHNLSQNTTYLLLFLDLDVIYGQSSTHPQPSKPHTQTLPPRKPKPTPISTSTPTPTPTSPPTPPPSHLTPKPRPSPSPNASYIAPRPPPASHHRYVYLLFEQPDTYVFPTCFNHIFPPTAEARAGFDTRQFVEVARLGGPVAGNWFYVVNDQVGSGGGGGGGFMGGMGVEMGVEGSDERERERERERPGVRPGMGPGMATSRPGFTTTTTFPDSNNSNNNSTRTETETETQRTSPTTTSLWSAPCTPANIIIITPPSRPSRNRHIPG
ncbi:citrate synthase [Aspergillus heteromorphus CBS 117.55]|uniref:Citrate synthase n=1 Tax=Aspergillus heteromorphus CBS 117.55 TaxID=1448321 RepID=A0A317WUU2_9EURO|nr:citrate synthase [Aspergillus heteromorphus CBS 117.55]PWY89072.1 citrate synthase [Aspergillus heteromorphus CBS 117.55]